MSPDPTYAYVRVTKLCDLAGASWNEQRGALTGASNDGSPDHVHPGYVGDGWFIVEPSVGESMVLLRFRRDGALRLGLFISSAVTFVGEGEIRTANSVYQIEHLSLE